METSLYSWYAGYNISFNHIILLIKIKKKIRSCVLPKPRVLQKSARIQKQVYVLICFASLQTVNCLQLINGGGFPSGSHGRVCLQCWRPGFDPWVGKIPWRRAWQPTPVFLLGESPCTEEPGRLQSWGYKESHTTERLITARHIHRVRVKSVHSLQAVFNFPFISLPQYPLLSRDVYKMHRVKHSAWYIERDSIFLNEQIIERINTMGSQTLPAPSQVSYYAYFVFWHVSLSIMTYFLSFFLRKALVILSSPRDLESVITLISLETPY